MRVDARTELVIAVDIAARLGLTKQRVGQLAHEPGFPQPIGRLGRSDVWKWRTVERWALDMGRLPSAS